VKVPYFLSKAEAVVGGAVGAEVVAVVLGAGDAVVGEAVGAEGAVVVLAAGLAVVELPGDDVLVSEPQPTTARHATLSPAPTISQHGRLVIPTSTSLRVNSPNLLPLIAFDA
jgi:hypothetical protein